MMLSGLNGTSGLTSGAGATTPEPRLVQAAHEFEGQLMKELLRPMTGGASLSGDDEEDSAGQGALGEFAAESLAGALSARGGFGIANRIVGNFSHSGNDSISAQGIGTGQIHGALSTHK